VCCRPVHCQRSCPQLIASARYACACAALSSVQGAESSELIESEWAKARVSYERQQEPRLRTVLQQLIQSFARLFPAIPAHGPGTPVLAALSAFNMSLPNLSLSGSSSSGSTNRGSPAASSSQATVISSALQMLMQPQAHSFPVVYYRVLMMEAPARASLRLLLDELARGLDPPFAVRLDTVHCHVTVCLSDRSLSVPVLLSVCCAAVLCCCCAVVLHSASFVHF
jgi:hypothetical protein